MKSENEFTSRKKYLKYLRDYYAGLAMQARTAHGFVNDKDVVLCGKASVVLAENLIAALYPNEN